MAEAGGGNVQDAAIQRLHIRQLRVPQGEVVVTGRQLFQAHPALGILDAAAIERLAADPGTARSLAGTGPYQIDAWTPLPQIRGRQLELMSEIYNRRFDQFSHILRVYRVAPASAAASGS